MAAANRIPTMRRRPCFRASSTRLHWRYLRFAMMGTSDLLPTISLAHVAWHRGAAAYESNKTECNGGYIPGAKRAMARAEQVKARVRAGWETSLLIQKVAHASSGDEASALKVAVGARHSSPNCQMSEYLQENKATAVGLTVHQAHKRSLTKKLAAVQGTEAVPHDIWDSWDGSKVSKYQNRNLFIK
jgi:hypothetical protein